jgi:hypothetical protein
MTWFGANKPKSYRRWFPVVGLAMTLAARLQKLERFAVGPRPTRRHSPNFPKYRDCHFRRTNCAVTKKPRTRDARPLRLIGRRRLSRFSCHLLGFGNRFVDIADHVESLLRQVIVIAIDEAFEAADCVF